MIPTPEMIEAAIDAYREGTYLDDERVFASVNAIVTAALALIPGEPVRWEVAETLPSGTIRWQVVEHEHHARKLAEKLQAGVRPLYAAPAPLPVAVKAKKLPAIGEELYEHYSVMSAQTHEALVKEYARKAIRSALSSPVGGMEERCAELNDLALARAREAYDRKWADMSSPNPTEDPSAGGGPLGYAILEYFNALRTMSSKLESDPATLHNYCQQLLDIIQNYDVEIEGEDYDLIAHIRNAVDPANVAELGGQS